MRRFRNYNADAGKEETVEAAPSHIIYIYIFVLYVKGNVMLRCFHKLPVSITQWENVYYCKADALWIHTGSFGPRFHPLEHFKIL